MRSSAVGPEVALGERVLDTGVVEDPALGLELGVELARPPAGVAGEDPHPGQGRGRVQVDHAHRPDDELRRLAGIGVLADRRDRARLHRPADVQERARPISSAKTPATASPTVDSEGRFRTSPKAPSLAVLDHQHHRPAEEVGQGRRGDQQLSAECLGHEAVSEYGRVAAPCERRYTG